MMKKILLYAVFFHLIGNDAYSQGCIAIRNLVGFGQFVKPGYDPLTDEPIQWLFNVNSRYFESSQTFDGSEKVYETPEDLKVNHTFVLDFSISRMLENGWSYTIDVPIMAADRTTCQEHNLDRVKHTTHAFGLGDIRVTLYKWVLDVSTPHRGNVQVGLGVKLPTGDYRYQDYFYKDSGKVLAPVNSTIQLGDGGTGFTIETNAYLNLSRIINLYGNLFYLFNPRDQNGVSNSVGGPPRVPGHPAIPSSTIVEATGDINSVVDSYTIRAGANFTAKEFTFWSGVRIEGSPVYDLIGESNGQRRAGRIVSVEPGINYQVNRVTLFTFVPIPIYRTTFQTVPDKRISEMSGEYVSSPGGFANYLIFIGAVFKL